MRAEDGLSFGICLVACFPIVMTVIIMAFAAKGPKERDEWECECRTEPDDLSYSLMILDDDA
jgi:hypothetical protein